MQNLMVVFTFSVLDRKYPFWTKLFQKIKTVSLTWSLVTKTNSNMQNSTVVFILSVLGWKYQFWANLIQKIKIVILSWNSVQNLIRISRIWWWFLFFLLLLLFQTGNTLFWEIWSIKSKWSVYAEIWYLDQLKYEEFNGDVHFFCFWPEIPFFANLSQNPKLFIQREIWYLD